MLLASAQAPLMFERTRSLDHVLERNLAALAF